MPELTNGANILFQDIYSALALTRNWNDDGLLAKFYVLAYFDYDELMREDAKETVIKKLQETQAANYQFFNDKMKEIRAL